MKDPREKLERFPKLGYYFISFRAIESWDNREKYRHQDGEERDHGVVGEANVYLVVFNEGVCSFHFTDIAGDLVLLGYSS
jgi:magnesium transporter